jgi:hypothetical protein
VVDFFSFDIDLSIPERGVSRKLFFKAPKSPFESYQYLLNRVLAYLVCYRESLTLSKGLLEPEKPSAYSEDFALFVDPTKPGDVSFYYRHHKQISLSLCFFQNEEAFFSVLNLNDTKWLKDIYLFSAQEIHLPETRRLKASVTIVDEIIYWNELQSQMTQIDPLRRFQTALKNT